MSSEEISEKGKLFLDKMKEAMAVLPHCEDCFMLGLCQQVVHEQNPEGITGGICELIQSELN